MASQPQRVFVTGGSGKAGRAAVADLMAHGWAVANVARRVLGDEPQSGWREVAG
jgi:NAD(P)-dependent dehydrogenase (short-subunit alcohol dehydrogenase family)